MASKYTMCCNTSASGSRKSVMREKSLIHKQELSSAWLVTVLSSAVKRTHESKCPARMNLSASNTDFGTSVISLLASFSKLPLTPSIAQTNTHTTLSPNLRSAELSLLLEPRGVWLSLLLERHICEVQICNRFWSLVLVVAKCRTVITFGAFR